MVPTEDRSKNTGSVFSINCSSKKGTPKTSVKKAGLIEEFGFEGDAHAGVGLRQVSLLAIESINRQIKCLKVKEDNFPLKPGDFAENITTEGVDLAQLKIGYRLNIGTQVILKVSKIGKECHKYCAIYKKIGDCIMPREGIFTRVLKGGQIQTGDIIEVVKNV